MHTNTTGRESYYQQNYKVFPFFSPDWDAHIPSSPTLTPSLSLKNTPSLMNPALMVVTVRVWER